MTHNLENEILSYILKLFNNRKNINRPVIALDVGDRLRERNVVYFVASPQRDEFHRAVGLTRTVKRRKSKVIHLFDIIIELSDIIFQITDL